MCEEMDYLYIIVQCFCTSLSLLSKGKFAYISMIIKMCFGRTENGGRGKQKLKH